MATNPIPVSKLNYKRAARDYPNYNGLLGIRGLFTVAAGGISLVVDTPYIIGKVPAGAFIVSANAGCTVAMAGMTTPILDIGLRDPVTGVVTRAGLLAAIDLSTPGVAIGAGANLGLQASEQEIVITLGGTGTATAGGGNALIQYVTRND